MARWPSSVNGLPAAPHMPARFAGTLDQPGAFLDDFGSGRAMYGNHGILRAHRDQQTNRTELATCDGLGSPC